MTTSTERSAAFRALHRPGDPFLLPNAWDATSGAALSDLGFPALGTTSLGVAAVAGLPDGTAATRAQTVALARVLGRLPTLLTVDVEAGFSDDPAQVADLVEELAEAGAVGVNLEDGRPDGTLAPTRLLVEKVAAVTERVPGVLVNARTDAYWLPGSVTDPAAEVVRRGLAYRDAGAHGFFVPALPDDLVARVVAEVPLPLNVLHRPGGPSLERLAAAGVARVSTGSGLYRTALHAALAAALTAAGPTAPSDGPPPPLTYADVGRLLEGLHEP